MLKKNKKFKKKLKVDLKTRQHTVHILQELFLAQVVTSIEVTISTLQATSTEWMHSNSSRKYSMVSLPT